MNAQQIQQVVDARNEELNKQNLAKATARLKDIELINVQIANHTKRRSEIQAEIAALQFDAVTVADVTGGATAEG